jgi:hypothetical protein
MERWLVGAIDYAQRTITFWKDKGRDGDWNPTREMSFDELTGEGVTLEALEDMIDRNENVLLRFNDKREIIAIAPKLDVIIISTHSRTNLARLTIECRKLEERLRAVGVRVRGDYVDNHKASFKYSQYEREGVPLRIEFGERELDGNSAVIAHGDHVRVSVPLDKLEEEVERLLPGKGKQS